MATIGAVFKFIQFFFWCAVLIPPQIIVLAICRSRVTYALPQLWHRMICRAFGLTVVTEGAPVTDRQVIYAGNHLSYLDITVISCVIGASFVAKTEVAGWPVFGILAKLHQTAFISRARKDAQKEGQQLKNMLEKGKSLIIFPEGTSSDGKQVLPFRSSLFAPAFGPDAPEDLPVQPFTVELLETGGRPVTAQQDRNRYAWYDDMTLMPHFWAFAKTKGAKVKLHFHPPIRVKDFKDRKELAAACQARVKGALTAIPEKAAEAA